MSLNLSALEMVRQFPNGIVQARCPACAEGGGDGAGEHLRIFPDGRFGCCVHPEDRGHRKRIFALAGDTDPRPIVVKPSALKAVSPVIKSGILGRLGRLFPSPVKPPKISDTPDGVGEVPPKPDAARTPRTGELRSSETDQPESRTLRTPLNSYTCGAENSSRHVSIELQGVPVGASEPSEPLVVAAKAETDVRGVRMPHLTSDGTLVIPFESPERFHWWKGGQSVAETQTEVESWQGK